MRTATAGPSTRGGRHGTRWVILACVAGAAAALAVAVALLTGGSPSPTVHIKGAVGLFSPDGSGLRFTGTSCTGIAAHADIVEGARVTIADDTGKPVAITALGPGSLYVPEAPNECVFYYETEIPIGSSYYTVRISNRDPARYTLEQMKQGPITVFGN